MPSMNALKETFEEKIGTPPKTAFASMILVASALVWGFYSVYFLTIVTGVGKLSGNEILAVRGINLSGIVAAALLGVFLVNHVKKRVVFLQRWMLGGVLLSLVPVAVNITGFLPSAAFFAITGIYFGLGMPVSLAYFSASTENENRSRLGGVIFLVAFFGIFLLGSLGITQIALNAFILAGFEGALLTVTFVLKPQEKEIKPGDSIGYRQILSNRSFLLYLVPWIMFIIVDFISLPIVNSMFPGDFTLIELSGTLLAGILAVVFGFFADYVGRKRLVVAGFALLGGGYASLSLFHGNNVVSFFAVVDGFAWGIFCVTFFMTIWGDLSQGRSSEKYYAIGILPFLFSEMLPRPDTPAFANGPSVPQAAVFSFASFFLFIAVLPLAYAPETLNLKDLEFKNYVERAIRTRLTHS